MADISRNLAHILKVFFTNQEDFKHYIQTAEKNSLEAALAELLTLYSRDKNSSTLREYITLTMAGYKWRAREKLGFNGWTGGGKGKVWAEVKPKNIERGKGDKYNGNGNFSDFTPERLDRYRQYNLNILASCFVDGELALILEFPFNCPQYVQRLEQALEKRFPGRVRPPGQFERSLTFSWTHYNDCPVKVHFLNRHLVEGEPELFTNGFRRWVLSLAAAEGL